MARTLEADQRILQSLNLYLAQQSASLPPENELAARYSFSNAFTDRMQPLFRKARRFEKRHPWAAPAAREARSGATMRKRLVLVAIIVAILASVLSITAARETVWNFIVQTYEKYSNIIFGTGDPGQTIDPSDVFNPDDLKLPAGYHEIERTDVEGFLQIVFTGPAGDQLIFEKIAGESLQMIIDSENTQTENLQIRGSEGLYYSNKGYQHIIWQEGPFVFVLSGIMNKEALLDMVN
jgi:hypothetical protein